VFGARIKRVRRGSKALARRIESIVYPLRTYRRDAVTDVVNTVMGSLQWSVSVLFAQTTVGLVLADAINHWPGVTPISGDTATDAKVIIEQSSMVKTVTNTSNTPVTVDAYWFIPRRDQPAAGNNALTLMSATTTGHTNSGSPLPLTDYNTTIWDCSAFLVQYKIIKHAKFTFMPGCTSTINVSVGRRVVKVAAWDNIDTQNIPPLYSKGYAKGLVLRIQPQLGINTTVSGVTSVESALIIRTVETYRFRPMIDMRPTYNYATSAVQAAAGGAVVDIVNPISGHVEVMSSTHV
jgi:hypothetical protein